MVEISASILDAKEDEAAKIFYNLEVAKIDYFHIDVMDGKFVEKDTYNKMLSYAEYIKRISNLPLDVHLMVNNVEHAINDFEVVEPNIITFHYEACNNKEEIMKYINKIKEIHSKVGISVKPDTPIEKVYEFLPYIHVCLVMTVEPGKGGQTMLSEMVQKVQKLKQYIDENNLEVDIEVDGGINLRTMESVKSAGANILVSGSAILKARDYGEIIKDLKS